MNTLLSKKIKILPQKPGIYLFLAKGQSTSGGKGKTGNIIYIGKAKNLKKRVSSYFQKSKNVTADKLVMISKIAGLEYIITDNETEALLLEANLIKKHQPQFNIILKDDKNFLYIKLNLEQEWARVEFVRRPQIVVNKNNKINKVNKIVNRVNKYFGPYASADSARRTVKLLSRIFKFCTCKNFTKKSCLKFHLGWCVCPAETKISNSDYRKIFVHVAKFLKGQTNEILRELKIEMKKSSNQKKYEKAAHLRDQIQAIKKVTAKQKVITLKNENYDIVSLARKDDLTCVNLFIVRHGKLINKLNFILEHTKNSKDAEIIESFISQYYANSNDIPKEIVVPKKLSIINYQLFDQEKCKKSTISTPSRGKKYQLITLGTQNAQDYLKQQLNNQTIEQSNNEKVLTELKKLLRLPKPPRRIEAYDISNIQGTDATGSLAVFTNGQPDKSEYRKFKIRTVKSASDVAMMAEVVSRRLQNKDWPKPDLILLDGGKPQLNAVSKINTVKLLIINYQLSIISLAKKEEHIFLPNRSQPIVLPKSSSVLQLLQRIRDEAHRFARSYYLKRHQKTSVHSALDDIPGIGPKTKKGLLQKFGSVGGIKKATLAEITKVAGKKRADAIQELL